jgi:16S rRNA (cytosine1402-N4)-methyltransferase
MPAAYHVPVLGKEVLETLLTDRNGVYVDGTLGGGGHAKLFLEAVSKNAKYIAIDRDQQAIDYARKRFTNIQNIFFYKGTFNHFDSAIKDAGFEVVDGLLLDLGVSSHQIDDEDRGFGFRPGIKLDMRMDQTEQRTAADILNNYGEEALVKIFKEYGEERYSKNIAGKILRERQKKPILISDQLLEVIKRSVPGKFLIKSYARIFQAIRIELNNELAILSETLGKTIKYVKSGGRVGVISYHSGEDRIVKNFFRLQQDPCICPKDLPYCVCGRKPTFKRMRPDLYLPGEIEIEQNPRARSAKYRVGERI